MNSLTDPTVRFVSLELNNFGCVKNGTISMDKTKIYTSDILGVYGQNGSGKSALVNALGFLRILLCGVGFDNIGNYVRVGEKDVGIKAVFNIAMNGKTNSFEYSVKIVQSQNDWVISEEKVVVSDTENPKNRRSLEYYSDEKSCVVKPASLVNKFKHFLDNKPELTKGTPTELFFLMQKQVSRFHRTSYLFQPDMIDLYVSYKSDNNGESITDYLSIINYYAQCYFFVIGDSFLQNSIQKNNHLSIVLPNQQVAVLGHLGNFSINLNGSTFVKETEDGDFFLFLQQINYFLKALSPGFELSAYKTDSFEHMNKKLGNYYDVFIKKNNVKIPIKYESLGIKKLISLVTVLVFIYKSPSLLIVIDEFDASLHEFVLASFLKAFDKGGKGQIIFTSNNLYPLEVLDKNQCCFTSTNEENRYVTLKYVKPNNNLRNLYLNEISGEKKNDSKNPDLFNTISVENINTIFDSSFTSTL